MKLLIEWNDTVKKADYKKYTYSINIWNTKVFVNSWSLIHGKSLRLCIILYIALLCLFPVSYQNTWGWVLYKVNKFLWVMLLVVGASQPLGPGILARTPWLYHKVAMASQWEPMSKGESIWWEGEPEVQGQACFHGDSLHPTRAALISFRANTLSDLTTLSSPSSKDPTTETLPHFGLVSPWQFTAVTSKKWNSGLVPGHSVKPQFAVPPSHLDVSSSPPGCSASEPAAP